MANRVNRTKVSTGAADASGDVTVYSGAVTGRILKIEIVYDSGMAATCKTAISAEKTY